MIRTRTSLVFGIVLLLVAAPLAPLAPTADIASAAQHGFVIEQGNRCQEVTPLGGSQNVVNFYDYRSVENHDGPTATTYSSHMPNHLQADDVSRLFLYEGPDGVSLVVVHNRLANGGSDTRGGSAATFRFNGLPGGGSWVVRDDGYSDRDDRYSRNRIDWTWYGDRTDGAAFRGLDVAGTSVTIRPQFDEDAALYDDLNRQGNVRAWQFLTGNLGNPNAVSLNPNRPVTIRTGSCGPDETPPDAGLSATSDGVVGRPVTFDARASSDDRGIAEYRWDFDGDGEIERTTTGPQTRFTYEETGSYDARVTVVDGGDNAANATAAVTIDTDDPPEAAFTVGERAIRGEQLVFDAGNTSDDTGVAEYRWEFGDNATANGRQVTHRFAEAGTYTVTLEAIDEAGQNATTTRTVEVRPPDETPPNASFSAENGTADSAITFDARASSDDRGIAEYRWDFDGDGTAERTTTNATTEFAFGSAGNYTATLTVADAAGNQNRTSELLEISPPDTTPPSVSLSASTNDTSVGEQVTFRANATDDRGVVEYRWDFDGNGTDRTTDEPTVKHAYDSEGNYTARVVAVDSGANTDADSVAMTVNPERQACCPGGGGSGGGGGGGGGGGSSSTGGGASSPPPVLVDVEERGENAALVDVRNARDDETVRTDLPETAAAAETGVRFERVAVDLADGDNHFAVETARTVEGSLPGEVTLGSLAVSANYLGADVERVEYAVAVEKSRLDEAGVGADDVTVYARQGDDWTASNATVEETDDRVRLSVRTDELSSVVVAADRPATLADANLDAETVQAGEPVVVTASVENPGDDAESLTLNLSADGEVVGEEEVKVPAGESREVRLTANLTPGTHRVAVASERSGTKQAGSVTVEASASALAVSDLSANVSTLATGDSVELVATVENRGDAQASREVALTLFGERVAAESVTIPAGESETVTFVRRVDAPGDYTATVGERSASLSVRDRETADEGPTGVGVSGFGVGAALVALAGTVLVGAALVARRRSRENDGR